MCPTKGNADDFPAEVERLREEEVLGSDMALEQAAHADKQAAKLSTLDSMCVEAQELGGDKIARFLFQCRGEFLRRSIGREEHTDVVKAVRRAARWSAASPHAT